MTELKIIIDTLLPGDAALGMPSASLIDFDFYLKQHNLTEVSIDFIEMLDKVCTEKIGRTFSELDGVQKMQAINACKLVDVRLFSAMIEHLLKAYYTSPSILMKIRAGSIPPFPNGNSIEENDWSNLETVYEKGKIFRDI
jgi:hypothetical protein